MLPRRSAAPPRTTRRHATLVASLCLAADACGAASQPILCHVDGGHRTRCYCRPSFDVQPQHNRTIKSNPQFQRLAIQMSQTFFVKNLQGKSVQVQLDAGLTVRQVKDQLAQEQNFCHHSSPDQIRLVFGGKELQDSNKVSDYNVGPGSNVNMVLRLQGGVQWSS